MFKTFDCVCVTTQPMLSQSVMVLRGYQDPPQNAKFPHIRLSPFLKILNISPLKDYCLDWWCFLNTSCYINCLTQNSIKSMLKISKNKYFLFKSCKNKHSKNTTTFSLYPLSKTKKVCCCQLPGNTGDRAFSVCKAELRTKYRVKV